MKKCTKPAFEVIGKEGSTDEGAGFFQKLWQDASENVSQIEDYVVRNSEGNFIGGWGIMSDKSRSFKPWENNFSEGLYLAGMECVEGSEAPDGWTKWSVPGSEYIFVENEGPETFMSVINYMNTNNIPLVGAAYDYTDFSNGKNYIYFPVKRI